ncbi:hypothetical protein SNEBB_004281 [Seison nebaliae]|nr:hypothetical protein SNEBB_004281 [Seison nebaliae]
MWTNKPKTATSFVPSMARKTEEDDEWETDPDFKNETNEKEQRWGAKTIKNSGKQENINMEKLREEITEVNLTKEKKKKNDQAFGYGGEFGVQEDRFDDCAVSAAYLPQSEKHSSQTDYAKGFGGKFGIDENGKDKNAENFDYIPKLNVHASQKDYAFGFGGKFGVQKDRVDRSACSYDERTKLNLHPSQKDHKKGFGGKFGVEKNDESTKDVRNIAPLSTHSSQKDYSKGFGGKYGVESDRRDKCAEGFDYQSRLHQHDSQKSKIGELSSNNVGEKKEKFLRNLQETNNKNREEPLRVKGKSIEQKMKEFNVGQNTRTEETVNQKESIQSEIDNLKCSINQRRKEFEMNINVHDEKSSSNNHSNGIISQNGFNKPIIVKEKIAEISNHLRKPIEECVDKTPEILNNIKESEIIKNEAQTETSQSLKESEIIKDETEEKPSKTVTVPEISRTMKENKISEKQSEIAKEIERNFEEISSSEENIYMNLSQIEKKNSIDNNEEEKKEDSDVISEFEVRALYEFNGREEDELTFKENDIITNVIEIDEGWWRGQCNGIAGLFPANYVTKL